MSRVEEFMVIGHRGASSVAPENTLAAVRKAVEIGVQGVEFDVRRTQDGQIVLMHDGTVDRTTNGKGKVSELPFDQIKMLEAGLHKGAAFGGERVPLLRNALGVLKGKAMPVIEIKDEGISKQVVSEVQAAGMVGEAAVICFNPKTLCETAQLEPAIRRALLIGEKAEKSPEKLIAMTLDAAADHPNLHRSLATPECIEAFHAEDMPVWVWTVNDEQMMRQLIDIGVDGITTDDPALLNKVL